MLLYVVVVIEVGDGQFCFVLMDVVFVVWLCDLVDDGIGMIEQWLKDAGVKLVSVQGDGVDCIWFIIFGDMNFEWLIVIFVCLVKVGFCFVDYLMLVEQV